MGFEALFASLQAAALRDVADHWNRCRGARRMPGWQDLDPAELKPHLPIVWSWRFDPELGDFVGRLAGEQINAAFGKSLRGKTPNQFFAPEHAREMRWRMEKVMIGPCGMRGSGHVFVHAGGAGEGERLILPLAGDGVTGDGVLGATVYRLDPDRATGRRVEWDPPSEQLEFFPL
ncbi:PAS domain-containing protein [Tistlia consotensis]|uniref:PAS domain-containing protein n=1 Tax=Tistlia consotensis USBA 355 TaxID=560819 RepID=A0A1Y6C212_9PROT|nr:PAS domain-containing protein [Tistlia consotensis]SMF41288.1 PAS domain-containing protein [Tistlia consotensis USBA 355]SNR73815.1 PAS domain-containing protein [Tistlia consotensis]